MFSLIKTKIIRGILNNEFKIKIQQILNLIYSEKHNLIKLVN
jgi:hypothetical protein